MILSNYKMKGDKTMTVTTERLELTVLTAEQLGMLINNIAALERELDIKYRAEPIEGWFRDIVAGQHMITERDADNYVWHSFWLITRKSDRITVGMADFKDIPDENGEVEIGYGLSPEFTGYGYMTETVGAMCGWALSQPGVKHITAETELDGIASQNILKRCGFREFSRSETVWWRL